MPIHYTCDICGSDKGAYGEYNESRVLCKYHRLIDTLEYKIRKYNSTVSWLTKTHILKLTEKHEGIYELEKQIESEPEYTPVDKIQIALTPLITPDITRLLEAISPFISFQMEGHCKDFNFDDNLWVRLEVENKYGFSLTCKLRDLRRLWDIYNKINPPIDEIRKGEEI
jgi:hypothetical protein